MSQTHTMPPAWRSDVFAAGVRSGNFEVYAITARIRARSRTAYVHVPIEANEPPRALPPRDGVANKNEFRAALGFPTF